jgi:hypothetical protein
MSSLIRTCCLMAAMAIAAPVLAQQAPATKIELAKLTKRSATPVPYELGMPEGYVKACGRRFVCYTGIPLNCTPQTRPYENVAEHQCFCVHDGCPQ